MYFDDIRLLLPRYDLPQDPFQTHHVISLLIAMSSICATHEYMDMESYTRV